METNRIIHGDALEEMRKMSTDSVDLVPTDPPYGYSFMGKDWDKAVPSVEIWKECLRVLKPGAFAFVMSSPRADVLAHMIVNLSDAGFRTDFTPIYWAYASGFPKALNISKAVDKRLGAERIISGPSKWHCEGRTKASGTHGIYNPPAKNIVGDGKWETKPATPEANTLEGSYGGFQPKPAVEVILVCMKPLSENTYVDQALKNGHGCTWLDNARIPFESTDDIIAKNPHTQHKKEATYECYHEREDDTYSLPTGRFPANLLVSDEALNNGVVKVSRWGKPSQGSNSYWGFGAESVANEVAGDKGEFSRFFDLDKWFSETVKKLPKEVREIFPFLICPKASKSERNESLEKMDNATYLDESRHDKTAIGCNNPRDRTGKIRTGNIHPTVKPLALMSYLITLGSRPNDLILDPFVGSGTTCVAAKMLGRRYIGIELEAEYVKIAEARVNSFQTLDTYAVNRQ